MSSNDFNVTIISPNIKQLVGNYLSLPNLSVYKIKLINNRETRCDAFVKIDGVDVGAWRIPSFDSITIERPANMNRRFVFIKESTYLAEHAGIERYDYNNGLISVTFKPELNRLCPYKYYNKYDDYNFDKFEYDGYVSTPTFLDVIRYGVDSVLLKPLPYDTNAYSNSTGKNTNQLYVDTNIGIDTNYTEGATMLGSGTDQNFNVSSKIYKYDVDNITTIKVRLIIQPKSDKQFKSFDLKKYPYQNKDFGNRRYVPINELTERYYNSDRALIDRPYFT